MSWGEPRPGHPEGSIARHIAELEDNLEALAPRLSLEERERLRVLIHVHDLFKPQARPVAIAHPDSHASLARAFLAEFSDDQELLEAVQLHDEPFALFRRKEVPPSPRWQALLSRICDWDTYLSFLIVDGCTAGKPREPLRWFFALLPGRVVSRVTPDWILPAGSPGSDFQA